MAEVAISFSSRHSRLARPRPCVLLCLSQGHGTSLHGGDIVQTRLALCRSPRSFFFLCQSRPLSAAQIGSVIVSRPFKIMLEALDLGVLRPQFSIRASSAANADLNLHRPLILARLRMLDHCRPLFYLVNVASWRLMYRYLAPFQYRAIETACVLHGEPLLR